MNRSISIMIIDDNSIDMFIHREIISHAKVAHTVSEYMFASEALAHLKLADETQWPDLILLDIHMPIMNGFEFLEKYKLLPQAQATHTKIIILSSSLDAGDFEKSKNDPSVIDLMEKPVNTDKLKETLIKHGLLQ